MLLYILIVSLEFIMFLGIHKKLATQKFATKSRMPRSVLIPVDGSENSHRAFDYYVSGIRHTDDLILLCHIQQTPHYSVISMHNPVHLPTEDWTSKILQEMRKSQTIITHYDMDCEQNKMARKVK